MGEAATTIHDLLTEVLIKIFKKLEEDSDLKNVQQVCRRWSELVDKRVGRKVCVGGEFGRRGHLSQVEMKQLCEIGVQSCHFLGDEHQSETVGEPENDDPQNPLERGLKYPYLLKFLFLARTLHSDVFRKLVEHAKNLSLFMTDLFVLSTFRNEDLKNLPFPKLKELRLGKRILFADRDGDFLPNLKILLTENRFPQLTRLRIEVARASFIDPSLTGMLITFVHDHNALQELNVSFHMTTDNVTPEPETPKNAEMKRSIIAGIRRRGEFRLRELIISTYTNPPHPTLGFPFPSEIEILKEFLLNIVSLESLCLTLEPIPSSTLQAVCTRNAATLQGLHICSDHSDLDCSVFTSLQSLQRISLSFDGALLGISKLPSTLTKICVMGSIQQAETEQILFNLPNIQEIKLDYEEPSITLDMLRRFNQTRRVNRLRVSEDCLVDGESMPLDGIPNNDPNNPEMLIIVWEGHCYYNYCLDWKLNEAGFYTNSHSPYENSDL